MSDEHLLPLHDEEESNGFDVVLRGYDRRQVEDYVERVEIALADADRQHGEDGERLTALEHQVAALQTQLGESEQRAAGLPEPASRIGERLATMLRLAEEEAEQIVEQARDRATRSHSDRTFELDRRESELAVAQATADSARVEAQRDAEMVRNRATEEATGKVSAAVSEASAHLDDAHAQALALVEAATEEAATKRRTAEEDVVLLHEKARNDAADLVEQAHREVAELAAQRDQIAGQLQQLRETLSAAMQPLSPPSP